MRNFLYGIFILLLISMIVAVTNHTNVSSSFKTIHVFVALCDNVHQGIVKVPEKIGNGKDPFNNLYWGAGYGIKNFFHKKAAEWELIETLKNPTPGILERCIFKHKTEDIFLLADAYDGEQIKSCTKDFLLASNRNFNTSITLKNTNLKLNFGGKSDLVAYIGHNGLMDFELTMSYQQHQKKSTDAIILACYSKNYFSPHLKKAQSNPILWTTHLMAPEAYTLHAAINDWLLDKSGAEIKETAAQTYDKYQNCGIQGARNLFTSGF